MCLRVGVVSLVVLLASVGGGNADDAGATRAVLLDDDVAVATHTMTVFVNGGNNSVEVTRAINMTFSVHTNFDLLLARIATKMHLMPHDCTPFSATRPRRPWEYIVRRPDVELEPPTERCWEAIETWTQQMRLYTKAGLRLLSTRDIVDTIVYILPAGEHWMWPGQYVGHRVTLNDVLVDGAPIELETLALEPRLFFIPRFVSDAEADVLVEHTRMLTLERSYVLDNSRSVVDEGRTSKQTWVSCNKDGLPAQRLICELDARIANTVLLPLEHVSRVSDAMQVVHYDVDQHYRSHHDFFDPTVSPDFEPARHRRQRLLTLFYYLNNVDAGGETVFPCAGPTGYGRDVVLNMTTCEKGIAVKPRKGSALLWYNLLAPGNAHETFLDMMSLHAGCDVHVGEKFGANKWIYNVDFK